MEKPTMQHEEGTEVPFMDRPTKPRRRGDLIAIVMGEFVPTEEEEEPTRLFWTLGRVTQAQENGTVTAWRRFGQHFVDKEVPARGAGVGADRIDMRAVESDMAARLAKNANANEFENLDALNSYLLQFMKATDGQQI
ncbi:hypothetical protein [Paraburkholderia adhaesiva]|uniref:hypothetical protein n=1 Tax=Paraburkholderia adhaesiva TaxID=2883244 RepID=UPI001F3845FA|nr:hypothetical protein [Paraburkholderia adhaesiva]